MSLWFLQHTARRLLLCRQAAQAASPKERSGLTRLNTLKSEEGSQAAQHEPATPKGDAEDGEDDGSDEPEPVQLEVATQESYGLSHGNRFGTLKLCEMLAEDICL